LIWELAGALHGFFMPLYLIEAFSSFGIFMGFFSNSLGKDLPRSFLKKLGEPLAVLWILMALALRASGLRQKKSASPSRVACGWGLRVASSSVGWTFFTALVYVEGFLRCASFMCTHPRLIDAWLM
jgi:hypothetical protein